MKLQILVSALKQDVRQLAQRMRLPADTILIDQCDENRYEEWEQDGVSVRCWHFAERGVGLSRNNALLRADGDIALFSDEDIVYDEGAAERILRAFEQHPEADMLLFNVRVQESPQNILDRQLSPGTLVQQRALSGLQHCGSDTEDAGKEPDLFALFRGRGKICQR